MIGGKSAAEGNVVDGSTNGIDIQGIAGVPDNSEIRFNNVGVGKDGTTTLDGSGAWSVGVNNADGVIIADNVVGNGESGLALANSSGLIVVRNFIGVDRRAATRGTNEGIDVQQTGAASGRRTCWSATTRSASTRSEGIIVSNADRTTVTGNLVTDNGEGISIDGDHNAIGPGNSVHDNFASDTGVAVHSGVGNTITQNSIYGNQGLGIDLGPSRRHSGRRLRRRHGAERPAELPGADRCVGGRRVARRHIRPRLEAELRVHDRVLRDHGQCVAGSNVEGATYLGSRA